MITLGVRPVGSGGGFSRMINGGGVLGGVGRSSNEKKVLMNDNQFRSIYV